MDHVQKKENKRNVLKFFQFNHGESGRFHLMPYGYGIVRLESSIIYSQMSLNLRITK
jgi:hypothetical protein